MCVYECSWAAKSYASCPFHGIMAPKWQPQYPSRPRNISSFNPYFIDADLRRAPRARRGNRIWQQPLPNNPDLSPAWTTLGHSVLLPSPPFCPNPEHHQTLGGWWLPSIVNFLTAAATLHLCLVKTPKLFCLYYFQKGQIKLELVQVFVKEFVLLYWNWCGTARTQVFPGANWEPEPELSARYACSDPACMISNFPSLVKHSRVLCNSMVHSMYLAWNNYPKLQVQIWCIAPVNFSSLWWNTSGCKQNK